MTYVTSGEVCKLLNITKYTLRHYIEQDLVRPAKVAQNGYQLFDEKEIYTLYQILFLKKAGFSLKDISETFSNKQSITLSYQEMLDQVEKQNTGTKRSETASGAYAVDSKQPSP
ncbi:MerR family transcriptional regulator [Bacillus sp. 7788]|uniref:MerR family transcriptional regulator n=1 Tax=Bacillus sp. 7788 TaxID=2021692 RepID=UPI0014830847|nr:MerR family transcriptional regulator [Bacillus sp. 7788]